MNDIPPDICGCWLCDVVVIDPTEADGWFIGHYDGQAHYVCSDHKDHVWDPLPLVTLTIPAALTDRTGHE